MTRLNAKENSMQYKTITLGLLQENPRYHEQLRKDGLLLPALNHYAAELKASHEYYKMRLAMTQGGPELIAMEAAELAIQDLRDSLPTGFQTGGGAMPPSAAAMDSPPA
jgi:hypothetical protein